MKPGAFQILVDGVLEVRNAHNSTLEIAKEREITQWDVYGIFRLYSEITGYDYEKLLYHPKSRVWKKNAKSAPKEKTPKPGKYDVLDFSIRLAQASMRRKESIENSLYVAKLTEDTLTEMLRRYEAYGKCN